MNYVNILKGWPPRHPPSELLHEYMWYKSFQDDQPSNIEMKKPTKLINQKIIESSCAEDQILENLILQNIFFMFVLDSE